MTAPVSAVRQCVELARKDLTLEWRTGEALLVTAPFGGVALLMMPLAVGSDVPMLREIGPGLYWVVVLLFGVLVTLRQSAVDSSAQLAVLRLSGVHAGVRLSGRVIANTALLLAFQILLAPVAVLFYDPDLTGGWWLLAALPLVAVGLAVLGAVANALAQGLAGRTILGPLLIVPVALPLLLGATQTMQAARYGRAPWSWLLLMLIVDFAAALTAGLLARQLEDSA